MKHYKLLLKVFFSIAFFLMPFAIKYNNLFLSVFIGLWFIEGNIRSKALHYKKYLKYFIILQLFFFITVLSLLYTSNLKQGIDEVIRIFPLFFLPIILTYYNNYNEDLIIFKSIIYGSLTAVIICWGNVFYEMINNKESLEYFFRWRHSNAQLTKIINTHPSYLSLYILTSLAIIQYYKTEIIKNRIIRYLIVSVFVLFMFSLLARISLFLMLLSFFIYIIYYKKYKYILFFISFGLVVFFITQNKYSSKYLKKRLIEQINFEGNKHGDKRFKRFNASYYTFLENPIFGSGAGGDDKIRRKYYLQLNDQIAYKENHNAHNQFLEYLSTYGALGGVSFILTFSFLLYISYKEGFYLYLYIISIFIIANFFESMLERTNGIVYFSLFSSLLLKDYLDKK